MNNKSINYEHGSFKIQYESLVNRFILNLDRKEVTKRTYKKALPR